MDLFLCKCFLRLHNCRLLHPSNMTLSSSLLIYLPERELQEDDEEAPEAERELGCDVIESGDVGVLFLEQHRLASDPEGRTDFPNFRSLLWRTMAQFPERVEPRTRELSPLLLRFIRLVVKKRPTRCILDQKSSPDVDSSFSLPEETSSFPPICLWPPTKTSGRRTAIIRRSSGWRGKMRRKKRKRRRSLIREPENPGRRFLEEQLPSTITLLCFVLNKSSIFLEIVNFRPHCVASYLGTNNE